MDIDEYHHPAIRLILPHSSQAWSHAVRAVLFPLSILLLLFSGRAYSESGTFKAVSGFDLNRYLGKWYEIARLPFKYENGLVNVTATYSLRNDGMVKVVNQGFKKEKNWKQAVATGKAKFASTPDTGHLRVSFFWIFYSDYIILDLDPEYQWALVCSSKKYLWILSRKPTLEQGILVSLLAHSRSLGFDTDKLYFTPQEW